MKGSGWGKEGPVTLSDVATPIQRFGFFELSVFGNA